MVLRRLFNNESLDFNFLQKLIHHEITKTIINVIYTFVFQCCSRRIFKSWASSCSKCRFRDILKCRHIIILLGKFAYLLFSFILTFKPWHFAIVFKLKIFRTSEYTTVVHYYIVWTWYKSRILLCYLIKTVYAICVNTVYFFISLRWIFIFQTLVHLKNHFEKKEMYVCMNTS